MRKVTKTLVSPIHILAYYQKIRETHFHKEIDSNLMLLNKTVQQMYGTSAVTISNCNLCILHRRKVKWWMEHSCTGVNTIIWVEE